MFAQHMTNIQFTVSTYIDQEGGYSVPHYLLKGIFLPFLQHHSKSHTIDTNTLKQTDTIILILALQI